MRTYDMAPFYRSAIGFDRVFDLLNQVDREEPSATCPPYDIEKVAEDRYRITMAVAGFAPDEIELTQHDTTLVVAGQRKESDSAHQYLYRGIGARAFRQPFNLAEYVSVEDAALENGLLTIGLKREVPDALKPRRITIESTPADTAQDGAPRAIGVQAEAA